MSIYTKTGDKGETSLSGNIRKCKDDAVFDLLGTLDELNTFLGALHSCRIKEIREIALTTQSDLLFLGSLVANKSSTKEDYDYFISPTKAAESVIDEYEKVLPELKNFILPGGSKVAVDLHKCRVICRRLERNFVTFYQNEASEASNALPYVNRLSDLFFTLARYANVKVGIKDIIWKGPK